MMTMTYLFIGMGIVSIGFLIYLLVKSFSNDTPKKGIQIDTAKRKAPIPGGESLKYPSTRTVSMAAPKKEFYSKVKTYRKNVRVNDIIVEEVDSVDPGDISDTILDVADAVETAIYLSNTDNQNTFVDPSPSYSDTIMDTPTNDNYSAPVQDSWSPSSDNYSAPVQDNWSSSPSYSDSSSSSYSDSSSSHSSYSDSSSSYSSYSDSSSSSSYDSGSSSFDSSSSSSSDSSW